MGDSFSDTVKMSKLADRLCGGLSPWGEVVASLPDSLDGLYDTIHNDHHAVQLTLPMLRLL